MSEKDFAIGTVGLPQVGHISKKPCYLLILEEGKSKKYFIAMDKPDLLNGFIQVKGIYTDESEDDISKSFAEIVAGSPKESILDMMFPWHKVHSIRSLVFNANKPSTLMR